MTIEEDEARGYACGPNWRLYLGDFRDTLHEVTCDLMCADPPYSPKTHAGQRTGSSIEESTIGYDAWTQRDADDLAAFFAERCRWWSVIFSDDVLRPAHESSWSSRDWYTFGPVAWVRTNPAPRMQGDGPTSAFDHLSVAASPELKRAAMESGALPMGPAVALDILNIGRPKKRLPKERMGSRPGYYMASVRGSTVEHQGGKDIDAMRAIIRDYTLPGDVVCDPTAGGGSGLLAAVIEGRIAVGSERDPTTWRKAVARLRRGYTPSFDFG